MNIHKINPFYTFPMEQYLPTKHIEETSISESQQEDRMALSLTNFRLPQRHLQQVHSSVLYRVYPSNSLFNQILFLKKQTWVLTLIRHLKKKKKIIPTPTGPQTIFTLYQSLDLEIRFKV